MPVLNQLDAEQETAPAHITDLLVALRQGSEIALEAVADRARLRRHVLALDDVEAGDPSGASERVVRVRMRVDKAALDNLLLDRGGRRDRADADAAAEMLGDSDHVGDNALGVAGEHRAELAEPGLLLVEDQQHAALAA